MKLLVAQPPTAEQLRIIGERRPGVEIIRGAAGSGKTTTALLRLKNLSDMFRHRRVRLGDPTPVQILVLTFNRTLRGFVEALAREQATSGPGVELEVDTFAHWAWERLGQPDISDARNTILKRLAPKHGINVPHDFLCSEVEYILGRFPRASLDVYLSANRTGRGSSPRIERSMRQAILNLIAEYKGEIAGQVDWDDIAILVGSIPKIGYDIAIIDEAQDFSANQIRAVIHHLNDEHALTLIIDTVQRLYPRGYTWPEVGIEPRPARFHRLQTNHRNTIEIARFARGIIEGLTIDDDGTLPDLDSAVRHGSMPTVLKGNFGSQMSFSLNYIERNIDLAGETVASLHPLGWFREIRSRLSAAGYQFEELSRERDWPGGPVNIALSTMHSAKGLEFDHVFILGLNAQVTQHGIEGDDHRRDTLRRLLAMAAARARQTLTLGYKPAEASELVSHFASGTYEEVDL